MKVVQASILSIKLNFLPLGLHFLLANSALYSKPTRAFLLSTSKNVLQTKMLSVRELQCRSAKRESWEKGIGFESRPFRQSLRPEAHV